MRWFGGITWDELQVLPADIVLEAIGLMQHEANEERARARHYEAHRGKKHVPAYAPAPYESPLLYPHQEQEEIPIEKAASGVEVVTKKKADGTVTKHRKLEDGDKILHGLFGVPPSWRGKV